LAAYKVCAIVPARNESSTIANVLRQLQRADVAYCVVVCNGCEDDTLGQAASVMHLRYKRRILHVPDELGPDVPRAFGTYDALQHWPDISHFIYVDGDFAGSFGPMLAAFIKHATSGSYQVMWSARSPSMLPILRPDTLIWTRARRQLPATLQQADPAVLPMMVARNVFHRLSPYWLSQPGVWFAMVVTAKYSTWRLGVDDTVDYRLLGNRVRQGVHDAFTQEILCQDAEAGVQWLCGYRRFKEAGNCNAKGGKVQRRLDLLKMFMASWRP